MKKTSLNLSFACIGLLSLAALLSNCKGEKGDPGPAVNGTNGAGFDEAVKNGNIVIYLDGKRPDGIAFKDTLNFKFSASTANDSYVYTYGTGADYDFEFYTRRFLTLDNYSDAYASIDFEPYIDAGDTLKYLNLDLNADVITSDYKYFRISDEYYVYGDGSGNVTGSSFTNFKYDPSKGAVRYKFKFMVAADDNATGFDLNVAGSVEATVYESIGGDDECGDCRKSTRGAKLKTVYKKAVKAEMKSLK